MDPNPIRLIKRGNLGAEIDMETEGEYGHLNQGAPKSANKPPDAGRGGWGRFSLATLGKN